MLKAKLALVSSHSKVPVHIGRQDIITGLIWDKMEAQVVGFGNRLIARLA